VSRVYTDTIEPRKPTQDITLGTSGETISVGANSINVNTVKDKGGNTLWTSDGSGNLSSVNSALKGDLVLLTTNTFSNASASNFTSGIDSTYDVYIFKFIDIHNDTDSRDLRWQGSIDGGSNYNVTMTTTVFEANHNEADSAASLAYQTGQDLAQSTDFQHLTDNQSNAADASSSGTLWLFNPSSTTYVKHWYATMSAMDTGPGAQTFYTAGYFNDTNNIDAVSFKANSGTFDGTIKMYGLL